MLHSRSFLHSFPARMAPSIALDAVERFPESSLVVDPMVGSGTVAISAVAAGHRFHGFDMDPLAALIASVSTTPLDYVKLNDLSEQVLQRAKAATVTPSDLAWISYGDETDKFIEFWFAEPQRSALSGLALQIAGLVADTEGAEVEALKVALSRIIVTKESKASLARDTSHSRPHKVADTNEYDVFDGFRQSVSELSKRHSKLLIHGSATIHKGDARNMRVLNDCCSDAIVSSPPYLNAIDYLRGHKLSLVWLGFTIPEIRRIRSESVGAERAADASTNILSEILAGFGDVSGLERRQRSMIARYAGDLYKVTLEANRVLKSGGTALYVMGNSCLKGINVDNATALRNAAELSGLTLTSRNEREIPSGNRYLPTPNDENALSGRMKREIVLTFRKDI